MITAFFLSRCARPLIASKLRGHLLLNSHSAKIAATKRSMKSVASKVEIVFDSSLSPEMRKRVGIWLLSVAGASCVTVIFGGITRLTKSGLSMVKWDLFREFPPIGEKKWQQEFEDYKKFPEFKLVNYDMTLEQFKKIWYMEYAHRSLARITGLICLIPFSYFWLTNKLPNRLALKGLGLNALMVGQGLLGWWMVKSGLQEDIASKYSHPHVSHYRLAAHLAMAFSVVTLSVYNGLNFLLGFEKIMVTTQHIRLRRCLYGLTCLVFVTAISGAFVSGLDAGLVYNSWPKMADRWFPSDYWAKYPLYSNVTENPSATQFNHRFLAHTAVASTLGLWYYSRKIMMPPRARFAMNCLALVALGQLSLGIATLLLYVPKSLASLHQTGALTLLSTSVWTLHSVKLFRLVPK